MSPIQENIKKLFPKIEWREWSGAGIGFWTYSESGNILTHVHEKGYLSFLVSDRVSGLGLENHKESDLIKKIRKKLEMVINFQ